MNPKAKPIVLIIVLMVLVIAVLRAQSANRSKHTETTTAPNIIVLMSFNTIVQ